MSMRDWLLNFISRGRTERICEHAIIDDRDADLSAQAIEESRQRLQMTRAQRTKVNEVVGALEKHLQSNNFGERLDKVFLDR